MLRLRVTQLPWNMIDPTQNNVLKRAVIINGKIEGMVLSLMRKINRVAIGRNKLRIVRCTYHKKMMKLEHT